MFWCVQTIILLNQRTVTSIPALIQVEGKTVATTQNVMFLKCIPKKSINSCSFLEEGGGWVLLLLTWPMKACHHFHFGWRMLFCVVYAFLVWLWARKFHWSKVGGKCLLLPLFSPHPPPPTPPCPRHVSGKFKKNLCWGSDFWGWEASLAHLWWMDCRHCFCPGSLLYRFVHMIDRINVVCDLYRCCSVLCVCVCVCVHSCLFF